ncbi:MAG: rhomboid family intramembrane serine protease [Kiritimatiellia bacterium]
MKVSTVLGDVASSATFAVVVACVLCFIVESVSARLPLPKGAGAFSYPEFLRTFFAINPSMLRAGAVWQPLTSAFLHGSGIHLVVNMGALLVTGVALEKAMGARRWLALFTLSVAAGALGFLLSLWIDPRLSAEMICLGASGGVAGCVGAVAGWAPRARVTLWLTVIPIPIRAWWLIPLMLIFVGSECYFYPTVTAYGAHLAAFIAGLAIGAVFSHPSV